MSIHLFSISTGCLLSTFIQQTWTPFGTGALALAKETGLKSCFRLRTLTSYVSEDVIRRHQRLRVINRLIVNYSVLEMN